MVNTGDLENSAERFQADTLARFENRGVDPMRPLLPPESLWLRVDELFSELKRWPRVQLKTDHLPAKAANTNLGFQSLPDLAVQAQQKSPHSFVKATCWASAWRAVVRIRAARLTRIR